MPFGWPVMPPGMRPPQGMFPFGPGPGILGGFPRPPFIPGDQSRPQGKPNGEREQEENQGNYEESGMEEPSRWDEKQKKYEEEEEEAEELSEEDKLMMEQMGFSKFGGPPKRRDSEQEPPRMGPPRGPRPPGEPWGQRMMMPRFPGGPPMDPRGPGGPGGPRPPFGMGPPGPRHGFRPPVPFRQEEQNEFGGNETERYEEENEAEQEEGEYEDDEGEGRI